MYCIVRRQVIFDTSETSDTIQFYSAEFRFHIHSFLSTSPLLSDNTDSRSGPPVIRIGKIQNIYRHHRNPIDWNRVQVYLGNDSSICGTSIITSGISDSVWVGYMFPFLFYTLHLLCFIYVSASDSFRIVIVNHYKRTSSVENKEQFCSPIASRLKS